MKYLKHSLAIHGILLGLLVAMAFWNPKPKTTPLKLVVLPRGTSLDAGGPGAPQPDNELAALPDDSNDIETPEPTPAPTPDLTPKPSPAITPRPTPAPTATPEFTPKLTPLPSKETPAPTPDPTPDKEELARKAREKKERKADEAREKKKEEERRKEKAAKKKKEAEAEKKAEKEKAEKEAREKAKKEKAEKEAAEKKKKEIASAYDEKKKKGDGDGEGGDKAGKTGVKDGVEGAPLPLDKNGGVLDNGYTWRALELLKRNFRTPSGFNDANVVSTVEWEILPDGTIQNIKVVKSTGNAELDRAAYDAVKNTGNLGRLPAEFAGRSLWVSMQFIYGG